MTEFDIIERYFRNYSRTGSNVVLGIGDDAAILKLPQATNLAVSTDTLVSGVHFLADAAPFELGYKCLAVNLSDIAAMGGEPLWATMSLTMPDVDPPWIAEFSKGFFELADHHHVSLVGGDLSRGPLSITIQILGAVPEGKGLRRAGAMPGDSIYITGELGMAALALSILTGELTGFAEPPAECLARLSRPEPRTGIGMALRDLATAAIDISDGLAADLGHLLQASSVGANINLESVPFAAPLKKLKQEQIWTYGLSRGDDYELCFTVGGQHEQALYEISEGHKCRITRIGTITAEKQLNWISGAGDVVHLYGEGYRHFQ